MIHKLLLSAAVCVGSLAIGASSSQADDCYYGRGHYRGGIAYRPPTTLYRSYGVYRPPTYGAIGPAYRPYSSYRPGYGGYIGPSVRLGYPGYGYGVPRYRGYGSPGYYGYGRSGVSIGIGF